MKEDNFINNAEILRFMEQLRENDIQIWAEGEKIRYRTRNTHLEPEVLEILKKHKKQILDFLHMIRRNTVPLTSIQSAYIVGQKAGCELGNTNAHYYIEYSIESLDIERFEQALNLVIAKNDALRMVITHESKASFLEKTSSYSVSSYTLSNEADKMEKRAQRSHYKYSYYEWPMFHFCVGKNAGKEDILHVDFDCIILDAWSARLMLDEVFDLYCGRQIVFPEISFMEYMKQKEDKKDLNAEEYWQVRTANMPCFPHLNFKKRFSEVRDIRFDRLEYDFSYEETKQLYKKIRTCRFTPAAVISTVFMKTLAQYSDNSSVAVNVTLFNRQPLHKDVNKVLGEFTNTAVISYEDEDASVLDSIRKIQSQLWKLVQYRDFNGADILKMLSAREPGKAVMPVVFTCMLSGDTCLREKQADLFKEEFAISQTPQVILDHHVRDDTGHLKISWDYVVEIFDRSSITEIFSAYTTALKNFIYNDKF